MMKWIMAAAGLAMATTAAAQTTPAATATGVRTQPAPVLFPIAPVDPVRLAAARPVIDRVWPLGTYARVMHVAMDQLVLGTMARVFAMKPDELAAAVGAPAGLAPVGTETIGQLAAKDDPYFRQRLDITMRVTTDEVVRLMTEVEPGIRDALAHSYARRFTVAELAELNRFFATPTGTAYAQDATTLMMSPDMMAAMQASIPRMIQDMPALAARIADATKGLPPVPKKVPPKAVAP